MDLRQARFATRETVIRAYGIWSGIDIYVNAHTRVIVDGVGIMGAFDQARDKVQPELGPDSPLVRVTGFALMARVACNGARCLARVAASAGCSGTDAPPAELDRFRCERGAPG